ncbi:sensor histidine kinase, partial [Bacillus pseudomycoides]|uniref:ATP-binding protein n=1 Tax=Bacillus pseudomycoides TaxID=64104 RepID=UPI00284BCF87
KLKQKLISNSILYEKSGKKIVIELLVENMNVHIKIKNFGQCISSKDLPYLFEEFYRGEQSRNAKNGGKGMGLALAKSIAKIHEGDIT